MHPTRRWVAALELDAHVRAHVDVIVAVMLALDEQLELVESELRRHARADKRCQALQTIFGVGPILACHLLAEIGDVRRFQRPRQLVRASGLDPTVIESADSKRPDASPSKDRGISAGRSSRPPTTATATAAPTTTSTRGPSAAAAAAARDSPSLARSPAAPTTSSQKRPEHCPTRLSLRTLRAPPGSSSALGRARVPAQPLSRG